MDIKLATILNQLNYWKSPDDVVLQDGTILICHLPEVAPLGYMHIIYPPLLMSDIEKIETLLKTKLPAQLVEFLLNFNGMDIFNSKLSIFGLKKYRDYSHFKQLFQPYDIIIENLGQNSTDKYIQFASYKESYNIFFKKNGDEKVYVLKKDNRELVCEYASVYEWLFQTIEILSQNFKESQTHRAKIKSFISSGLYKIMF